MTSEEIRKSFLQFFKERDHAVVPSSSLVPDDPSVLLTTAGMQQFKKYYTGERDAIRDFNARNTISIQKSFRTSDIEEVGDETHLTFFEMLGNFSFGGYLKEKAIRYAYDYLTNALGISPTRISVTVFAGDKESNVPFDQESHDIWHKDIGIAKEKISAHGRADNFWGPTGNEGPCGPTTEIYVDGVEIWNLVFNQYYCKADGTYGALKASGLDTGMGLERLVVMLQGVKNVFESDLFAPIMKKIYELAPGLDTRAARVIADHIRGAIFLIADGVRPSNKEAGYILRRLLRRVLAYVIQHDVHGELFAELYAVVREKFGPWYPELMNEEIVAVMHEERDKFQKAIANGLKELNKFETITAQDAFYLYETFGLPFELVQEMAGEKMQGVTRKEFGRAFETHQKKSRAGAEKKFGGHGLLLDTGELKAKDEEELKKVMRLHTATHMMQAALRKILGPEVQQRGSDITAERTRFDFAFSRKLTDEEKQRVEDLVNEQIKKDLPVGFVKMPIEAAKKTGALYFFKEKYPEEVNVYYVGHSLADAFSKEFCGGPHVTHTREIGRFKILKEEAVGAGVRRIRATVSP